MMILIVAATLKKNPPCCFLCIAPHRAPQVFCKPSELLLKSRQLHTDHEENELATPALGRTVILMQLMYSHLAAENKVLVPACNF